jgi:hypothetical protein
MNTWFSGVFAEHFIDAMKYIVEYIRIRQCCDPKIV